MENNKQNIYFNRIDVMPVLLYVSLVICMAVLCLKNVISIIVPMESITDETRCLFGLTVILLFYELDKYRIPYFMKKCSIFLTGILFSMSVINSDFPGLLFVFAVGSYMLVKNTSKRFWQVLLVVSCILFGIKIFAKCYGYDKSEYIYELLSGWGLLAIILISTVISIVRVKGFHKILNGKTARICYQIVFSISIFLIVFWIVMYIVATKNLLDESFNPLFVVSSNGQNGLQYILSLDGRGKLFSIILIIAVMVLQATYIYVVGKKEDVMVSIFLWFLTCYSILFTGIILTLFLVLYNILLLVMKDKGIHWSISAGLQKRNDYKVWIFFGLFLLLFSCVTGNLVAYWIGDKFTQQEVSFGELRESNRTSTIKGFDVLEDDFLVSNETYPWIAVWFDEFGIHDVESVNIVVASDVANNERISVHTIGSYEYDTMILHEGNNYLSMDFIDSGDEGIRIDFASLKSQMIKLEKIVFNDDLYFIKKRISGVMIGLGCYLLLIGIIKICICIPGQRRLLKK